MAWQQTYEAHAPAREEVDGLNGPVVVEFGTNWCGYCGRAQTIVAQAFEGHTAVRHIKAAVPDVVWERCLAADGDPRAVRLLGTDLCEELSRQLLDAGAPGLHLYTMNRAVAPADLVRRLGVSEGPA